MQALQIEPMKQEKKPVSVKLADLSQGLLPKYAEQIIPGHVIVHKPTELVELAQKDQKDDEEDFLIQTDSQLKLQQDSKKQE